MSAREIIPAHAQLDQVQQAELEGRVFREIDSYLRAKGKSNLAGLYFLVAFTWGWSRRVAWSLHQLLNFAGSAWSYLARKHGNGERAPAAEPWESAGRLPNPRKD